MRLCGLSSRASRLGLTARLDNIRPLAPHLPQLHIITLFFSLFVPDVTASLNQWDNDHYYTYSPET